MIKWGQRGNLYRLHENKKYTVSELENMFVSKLLVAASYQEVEECENLQVTLTKIETTNK